jgi:hypothetical protein
MYGDSRLQSLALWNDVHNWTYGELSFHAVFGLPEYYVNQIDENTLPHYVEEPVPQV